MVRRGLLQVMASRVGEVLEGGVRCNQRILQHFPSSFVGNDLGNRQQRCHRDACDKHSRFDTGRTSRNRREVLPVTLALRPTRV